MILVDTSIWIDHFREGSVTLANALEQSQVVMHPFILGELACGNLKNRKNILQLLSELPKVPLATDQEALTFIERHLLMGKGVGYIDIHLLTSTALADSTALWSRDKRLANVAKDLNLAFTDASETERIR